MRSILVLLPVILTALPAQAARPEIPSVGVGVGVSVPSAPIGLNAASVRFRLSSKFAVEPMVVVRNASTKEAHDAEDNDGDTTSVSTTTTPEFGAQARIIAGRRGPVDLNALIGAGISNSTSRQRVEFGDPELDEPTYEPSSATSVNLSAGLGVEAFLKQQWSVGMDANVPLVGVTSRATPSTPTDPDNDDIDRQSSTSLNLGWAPRVTVFTHIYF